MNLKKFQIIQNLKFNKSLFFYKFSKNFEKYKNPKFNKSLIFSINFQKISKSKM